MIVFILLFIVSTLWVLHSCCDVSWPVYLALLVVSVWIGVELCYAYEKAFCRNEAVRYKGNLFIRLSKFVLTVCFNLCVIAGSIAFFRNPDSLSGDIGLFFFLTVLGFRGICLLVYQPDPATKETFDKNRWLAVANKDKSTVGVTDKDYHAAISVGFANSGEFFAAKGRRRILHGSDFSRLM